MAGFDFDRERRCSSLATSLDQSYNWCYRIARDSGSSFYRAFWLLDKQQRLAMFALYAFARVTDDLSDEPVEIPSRDVSSEGESGAIDAAAIRTSRLIAWSRMLGDQLESSVSSFALRPGRFGSDVAPALVATNADLTKYEPLWPALRDTVNRYGVPPSLLQELVGGVAMDIGPVRMQDWDAVDDYAYRVAATVGLACTRIWRAADTLPPQQAIDCGIAFQLTNILRDIREDASANRIYLPIHELEKFGCNTQPWLDGHPDGDWPGLVAKVIQRTRGFYESGKHMIDHLPRNGKRIFGLMWNSYRQLLETVATQQNKLWSKERITLSRWTRARLLANAVLFRPRIGSRKRLP